MNVRPSTSNSEFKKQESLRQPSFSVYSQESIRQPIENNLRSEDFYLYDGASNFNTPSTMSPLFNNSQTNVDRYTPTIKSNNSLHPAPLNIQNTTEITQNSETSSLTRSSLPGTIPSSMMRPYDLSGNGVLPNVPFEDVRSNRGNIPLNNAFIQDRTLPILPINYENNLSNVADTPRIDDPISFQYISRHRQNNYYNPNISPIYHEMDINKPGMIGKVKLVFKNIGSKFHNGVNKIESAYLKYETVSRRHII
jgi:hypothetical protein